MNKKFIIGLIVLFGIVCVSGCTESQGSVGKQLESEAGLNSVQVGDTFGYEQKFTEKNQQTLVKANPNPTLDRSLERENLIRRYEFLNDQNKIFYVYLIDYGKVMGYYTAKGKISSVNSRLTQEEQVIRGSYGCCDSNRNVVVGSPQLDGSYGTNGDGIFFFTTEGAYVEWNGMYLVSDFPLSMTTPPTLIQEV